MTDEEKQELEILRARVGWQDWLDTPEGRRFYITNAIIVDLEELYSDLDSAYFKNGKLLHKLQEMQDELKITRDKIKNILSKNEVI